MRKLLIVLLVLSASMLIFGCKKNTDSKVTVKATRVQDGGVQIRPGFVYIGHIGDAGWTFSHDQGRQVMERLPFVDNSTYIEGVPEGADAVRVISSLVEKGHNVIFANSYGYMDAMVEVSKKNPDVIFMHASGYKVTDNMGTYFGRIEEARYLTGIVAGKMTKSNIIGYVAAYPIPEVIRGINSFALGVQSVNPEAVVKVVWTQTWYDPALERSSAESLLDVGADVLAMHQDTPSVIQAAKDRNKFAIGYHSDMSKYAPESFLTGAVWNWGVFYEYLAKQIHDGKWTNQQFMWGIKEGLVDLAPYGPAVTEDIKALVQAKRDKIVSGEFNIFQGPIVDRSGKVMVAEGAVPSEADLLSMNYFIKGVQGTMTTDDRF